MKSVPPPTRPTQHGRSRGRSRGRRGQALVEFAILSFVLYLVVAAVFTFGRALFVAQVVQQTSDVFAHELARTPLPPTATLADALRDPAVTSELFDQAKLDVDVTAWVNHDGGLSLDQYLQGQGVPLINRMLAPAMILDDRTDGSTHLWYPGATDDGTGRYVVSVLKGDGSGPPITVPVVQALGVAPGEAADPFPLSTVNGKAAGGLAAVRLNYAYQSAGFTAVTGDKADPTVAAGEAADPDRSGHGLYRGTDHLGQAYVAGRTVRPFQRLIFGQAVYRRELFGF